MGLTKMEAYEILGLSKGALVSDITGSYKRLALQWYPQENKYSTQSIEKFKQISHAYKLLVFGSNETMAMGDMIKLFKDVFTSTRQIGEQSDDSYDSSVDDDLDGYFITPLIPSSAADYLSHIERTRTERNERAMQNAKELIEEEEKEKKKAEKRRAKKKRQKLKKKQEKESSQKQKQNKKNKCSEKHKSETTEEQNNKESSSSDSEEEDIDPNSAFVAIAASKKKVNAVKKETIKKSEELISDEFVYSDTVILQSRQIAARAFEMANLEQYQAAIDLFTEAIKRYPKDFRYFGNRSYCFDRIMQYERALKDAEKAILLSPQWAKGYFRKGRALCGLKKYSEAEICFETVLKLDKECSEASQELVVIRMLQLIEMGFSKQQAERALEDNKTVQEALELLVIGNGPLRKEHLQQLQGSSGDDEIYQSDEDDFITASRNAKGPPADEKMDHRNPGGHTSLWVGNIVPEVTEKMLTSLFRKYGDVWVRVLPERSCAFVNFKDKNAPGRAMKALQGKEVGGVQLLIRFPDNPHAVGQEAVTVLRKKINTASAIVSQAKDDKLKPKGPINGNECYFFRTSGCAYGNNCRYRHVKEHQGIDFKKL